MESDVPEAKAPEPLPNDEILQEKVLKEKVEEKTLVEEALPKKRGRGRPPGAKKHQNTKGRRVFACRRSVFTFGNASWKSLLFLFLFRDV